MNYNSGLKNTGEEGLLSTIDLLKQHGYPLEGVFKEYKVNNLVTDLAVVEPGSGELLAIIETKTGLKHVAETADVYAKRYTSAGINTVPLFLVFFNGMEKRVFSIQDGVYREIDDFPPYTDLKNKILSQIVVNKKFIKKEALNGLSWTSRILGGILIILLVCDAVDFYKLSLERLSVIAIITALLLLPFASKLKILGFEFEEKVKKLKS